MSDDNDLTIRRLNARDYDAIARIATEADYVYRRFDQRELERILTSLPAVGVVTAPPGPLGRFTGGTLHAFLLVNQPRAAERLDRRLWRSQRRGASLSGASGALAAHARSRCGATRRA